MIWEIEIQPLGADPERNRVAAEFDLLTHSSRGSGLLATSRGYLIEGEISQNDVEALAAELLTDSLVERASVGPMVDTESSGDHGADEMPLATPDRRHCRASSVARARAKRCAANVAPFGGPGATAAPASRCHAGARSVERDR